MTEPHSSAGPGGEPFRRFEDGLRFLATALALHVDHRSPAPVVSAACDAVQCFLKVFELAAQRHLPDPQGEFTRLRDQCVALLTPQQNAETAAGHAIEAAKLARDQAARLLPSLL